MGRIAKSREQRIYEGNVSHRPLPPPRPQYPEGAPTRPKGMTAGARRVWDAYIEQMAPMGFLRLVDRFALERLCEDVALLKELQKGMQALTREMKRKAKTQGQKISGSALVMLAASQDGRRLTATINALASRVARQEMQFGLTPVSAQRLEGGGMMPSASIDPIEQLLGGPGIH